MANQEIKTNIEVSGAILTPQLIEFIKDWQQNDNENVRMFREILADAVCFIGSITYTLDHEPDRKKALQSMADISNVRDYLENLKKP